MKLSFSTLCCPEFDWKDICSTAKDLGFSGIELRGDGEEIFAVSSRAFKEQNLPKTIERLKALKLNVPCISSPICVKYPEKYESNMAEVIKYLELAQKLGSSYIRILGDELIAPVEEANDEEVIRQMKQAAVYAEKYGVTLLIETNGVYSDTEKLVSVLSAIASDSVGALWDVHHPYRFANETPEKTVQNLGAYIKHVHIKDSVMEDGKVKYKMLGEGDLPIDKMMNALSSVNYDGYLSLEWLKKYIPELENVGVVLPHYADSMSKYVGVSSSGRLYDNAAHTGKYVWPKETLIDLTLPQVLDRMVEEFPDQCAFKYTTLDYTRTYKEFRDDVDAFARTLIALGVKPGDHVAIWATNLPQWYITFWATTKIGAVLVTVNTAYKIHEVQYLLRQSDTHTLVMIDSYKDSDYAGIIQELCPELKGKSKAAPLHTSKLPFLRNVITVGFEMDGCLTWEESLELGDSVSNDDVTRRAMGISKNDVCNMQYTSGTTGFPKGVMLTHYNVVNNGKAIGDCMDLSTADRLMIQVPMFHCFGMVLAMMSSMTHGTSMYPIPAFSPSKGLACINSEKITAFHGVPTMFITMLSHKNFESTDFSHMRTGIMAGSPCPIKVMQEVIEKMNMKDICITYGQTEASPACTMSKTTDPIDVRVETVGSAIFGVDCKIVDPETGDEVPVGVDGEFVARGYNIMKGYYKMPEATASTIDKDGWLHTGDLARKDENGNYRITGRIKDMIIRGGENIYPKELEDFIYTHPKVHDVQVIGVADKDYGEEVMACVILKDGETSTPQEIKDYVLSHMAKHKTPRYVVFVDSFPMNAAGKILKYKMRENAPQYLKNTQGN